MGELSSRNFGLLIAYLLPGFVTLWSLSLIFEDPRLWLLGNEAASPSVGGFLYATLGSVAAGMTVSALRWAVLDSIHHATGVARPRWRDADLAPKLQAYQLLVEIHYRYYQFYANMLAALLIAYPIWRMTERVESAIAIAADAGFAAVAVVFFLASRDALGKYYRRTAQLLGEDEESEDEP